MGGTVARYNKDLSKSSNTARQQDFRLISMETSQRVSEPIDVLIIKQTERERSKTTKNEQAKIIGDMEYHLLQHKLLTREGGATLNNDGAPFCIEQMDKLRLIKSNKTHQLRMGIWNAAISNMNHHCKPHAGSYILNRMNANQKVMNKYR